MQSDTVTSKINKIPYKHVDVLARFPQGDFKTYISNNLKTNHTFENSIKGQIILLMSIGPDGDIVQVKILKSLSPKIDPEVVKVINASPKWESASLNGQKVSMDMVLNIDIAITGTKKAVEQTKVIKTAVANISKPIYAMAKPSVIKPATTPSVKKAPVVAVKKPEIPPVKKPLPPVRKKPAPIIAKKVIPPVVKKPAPVIVKKVEPPVIKKTPPVITKKIVQPIVKKPTPVIAKKVEPPVIKKAPPIIAKKVEKPIAKKSIPAVIKQPIIASQPAPVKKRKRVVIKQDLFNPNANTASFIGGDKALAQYLGENIAYPDKAKKAGIEGRVVLSFVVEEDGTVDDVEVVSSPSEDLSQEAIRVMLASPKWKPGQQNGILVPVSFIIPIKFSLTGKQTN
ncbi:TonB family protein [Mucilaginibacter sp.]|uniref:TonB family protein n=1 Tax=Mucilaginibacter sp. TaxID=1882438 RepID=UPI003265BA7D